MISSKDNGNIISILIKTVIQKIIILNEESNKINLRTKYVFLVMYTERKIDRLALPQTLSMLRIIVWTPSVKNVYKYLCKRISNKAWFFLISLLVCTTNVVAKSWRTCMDPLICFHNYFHYTQANRPAKFDLIYRTVYAQYYVIYCT